MKNRMRLAAVIWLVFNAALSFARDRPKKPETPHLAFVTEYVRELAATEDLREAAERELKEDPKARFSSAIHSGTLMQLELGSQIRMLKDMRLDEPFDTLIPDITAFYEKKIALWKRTVEIATEFAGGPKAGVDYQKLATEMPQIRAQLDYIDKALFDASVLVAMTLLDTKPDSNNRVARLIITKEERSKLIDDLDTGFGTKLDEKDQNYTVTTAQLLRDFLRKHKASDEP